MSIILDSGGIISDRGGIIITDGIDSDALAYIDAVKAAGATVSGTQVRQIDSFYKTAKLSYYTSIKRLYLPIWGVAAANAIDMIGLTSGTFSGGVTHGAGFVQGNGSTGYFSLETTYSGLGLTDTDCMQFAGLKADTGASTMCLIGVAPDVGHCFDIQTQGGSGSRITAARGLANFSLATPAGDHLGIFVSIGNTGGGTYKLARRSSSGITQYSDTVAFGSLPTETIHAMKLGAPDLFYHTGEVILYGVGTALSDANTAAFSLALKNLWEGTTGLTLP
jgi:hypothetical protein